MVRIFYGVAGEGSGHALRSRLIIEELKKKHTVHLFSHGQGYCYLRQFFPVNRIIGFHMYYLNNTVSSVLTAIINLIKFPFMVLASLKYIPAFLIEKPDVAITDFEPFILYWSKLFNVPCISIDNQHSITNTIIDKIKGEWLSENYSKLVIHTFLPSPTFTIITTFFNTPVIKNNIKNNTILVPPLIRKEIIAAKECNKCNITNNNSINNNINNKHIFVYQTSRSYKHLFTVLKKIKRNFIIYGFGKEVAAGNLFFRKFSIKQYVDDMKSADAVIINGGFNVLTEALYLQKPIFSVPIKRQFEQILNGFYLQKLGYGMAVKNITLDNFHKFLEKKEEYKKNIKKIKWDNNKEFFERLDWILFSAKNQ